MWRLWRRHCSRAGAETTHSLRGQMTARFQTPLRTQRQNHFSTLPHAPIPHRHTPALTSSSRLLCEQRTTKKPRLQKRPRQQRGRQHHRARGGVCAAPQQPHLQQQKQQQQQHGTNPARAWLHQQHARQPPCVAAAAAPSSKHCRSSWPPTAADHGRTATCFGRSACQNMLTAVMYPHVPTGYKDTSNAANRTDKHNGSAWRRFESTTAKAFAPITERPIQWRRDGLPVSAVRVPGKPLMAPKLPSAADLGLARQRAAAARRSSITFASRGAASSPARHFQSVSRLVFTAPHRSLGQPNPGIAADDAARVRRQLGLFARRLRGAAAGLLLGVAGCLSSLREA